MQYESCYENCSETQNLNTKSKMAESWFASSDEIVVNQLKLNKKTKTGQNQHKRG